MLMSSEFWKESLNRIVIEVMAWLPALASALVLFVLGVLAGRLVQASVSGALRRLGLDRLAEKTGVTQALRDMGLTASASSLMGRIVYWFVLLFFVLAAVESLGLEHVTVTLDTVIAYVPKLVGALLIFLIGGFIAHLVGDALGALASQSGIEAGPLLGKIVRYVLWSLVVILALGQMEVETTLLTAVAVSLIITTAVTMTMAFGLGSRELARNIMAGFHVPREFTIGQTVTVRNHTGKLVRIGAIKSAIETNEGRVSLPNFILTEEEVMVQGEEKSETRKDP